MISQDALQIAAAVKAKGRELGFDLVGIASAEPSQYRAYLRRWLDDGQAGTMRYLSDRFDERTDLRNYLPGAATVVCAAMNYHVPLEPAAGDSSAPRGRIARYALGDDYHDLLKARLHALADWLAERWPLVRTRCAVDTAPVMEKELAARAGIGWLGKNTCTINEEIGSWLLLGEILTTLPLPPDEPAIDRCGSCRRCIEACPTQAITNPYQLDARRCISYLTIEHRGDIADDLSSKFGQWIYGCDICQDVCPWNRRPPSATAPALQPRFPSGTIELEKVQNWTEEEYRLHLRGSAMKRVKLPILKRNASIAAENMNAGPSVPKNG